MSSECEHSCAPEYCSKCGERRPHSALPIFNPERPITIESAKKAGIPQSETQVLVPRLVGVDSAVATEAVLTALETRAKLLAAEQACEALGRLLSEQIRAF